MARVIGAVAAGAGGAEVCTPPQAAKAAAQTAKRAVVREVIDAPESVYFRSERCRRAPVAASRSVGLQRHDRIDAGSPRRRDEGHVQSYFP
jgi:NAD(P)H-hydrate repair Nnr-like enzyme with NAD(P)H-hydrate dehydratase domain